MLNKIMMTGRLTSEPALTTDNGDHYCRFGIEVERPRHYMTDTSKSDTFICIAYDRNGEMISNLFSEGETITMVGSLRNAGNNSTEIVVEEVHFSSGGHKNTADAGLLFLSDIVLSGMLNQYFEYTHYNAIRVNLKKIKNST